MEATLRLRQTIFRLKIEDALLQPLDYKASISQPSHILLPYTHRKVTIWPGVKEETLQPRTG